MVKQVLGPIQTETATSGFGCWEGLGFRVRVLGLRPRYARSRASMHAADHSHSCMADTCVGGSGFGGG